VFIDERDSPASVVADDSGEIKNTTYIVVLPYKESSGQPFLRELRLR